jgi:hypothetical protein
MNNRPPQHFSNLESKQSTETQTKEHLHHYIQLSVTRIQHPPQTPHLHSFSFSSSWQAKTLETGKKVVKQFFKSFRSRYKRHFFFKTKRFSSCLRLVIGYWAIEIRKYFLNTGFDCSSMLFERLLI